MNEHNLDDLIVGEKPEKSKSKGLLAVFALFVAVLVVAIVMTQMFLSENDENSTIVKESTHEEMISPELQFEPTNNNPEQDKEELEQLSSILEDDLSNNIDTTPRKKEIPNHIKPETAQIDESKKEPTVVPPKAEKKPAHKQAPEPEKAEKRPKPQKPKVEQPKVEHRAEPAKVHKPKKVVKRSETGNYFIQVGSFTKEPNKRFLSSITRSGFRYRLINKRLLIGPYSSRDLASRALPKVKDKINKSAFIKKI